MRFLAVSVNDDVNYYYIVHHKLHPPTYSLPYKAAAATTGTNSLTWIDSGANSCSH